MIGGAPEVGAAAGLIPGGRDGYVQGEFHALAAAGRLVNGLCQGFQGGWFAFGECPLRVATGEGAHRGVICLVVIFFLDV